MELIGVFNELKIILQPYQDGLDCNIDTPGEYYLDTKHQMKNKKALFFGAVKINKNYVSYHLMPVYVRPDLLKPVSVGLMKHMQGKSCFNFKSVDKELFDELRILTKSGYDFYQKEGYLKAVQN